jgi:hypothetical protein
MPVILKKDESLNFLKDEALSALEYCKPLNDKIGMKIDIAAEILTQKQKDILGIN